MWQVKWTILSLHFPFVQFEFKLGTLAMKGLIKCCCFLKEKQETTATAHVIIMVDALPRSSPLMVTTQGTLQLPLRHTPLQPTLYTTQEMYRQWQVSVILTHRHVQRRALSIPHWTATCNVMTNAVKAGMARGNGSPTPRRPWWKKILEN